MGGYYNTDRTPGLTEDPARRPFPYITPTFYDRSIGSASYNALQFEMKKRYTRGLGYQVAYTYSKSIDEGSSGWFGVEGQSLTDPYNIKTSRGPSGYDLTHTLSFNAVYEIPVGKGALLHQECGARLCSGQLAGQQYFQRSLRYSIQRVLRRQRPRGHRQRFVGPIREG